MQNNLPSDNPQDYIGWSALYSFRCSRFREERWDVLSYYEPEDEWFGSSGSNILYRWRDIKNGQTIVKPPAPEQPPAPELEPEPVTVKKSQSSVKPKQMPKVAPQQPQQQTSQIKMTPAYREFMAKLKK